MPDDSAQPESTLAQSVVSESDAQFYGSIYQTLAARRLGYDTMMWQVPALSFTAQAFLLTIALGGGIGVTRLTSAALALIIALISIQLMAKQRFGEEVDARLLEAFEKRALIVDVFGFPPHASQKQRLKAITSGTGMYEGLSPIQKPWYVAMSSYRLWQAGLFAFACTSAAIVIVNSIYLAGWDAAIGHGIHWVMGLLA